MQEETQRTLYIGWGLAFVGAALSYFIGGPFWAYGTLFLGATLILRGYKPGYFKKSNRAESILAWMIWSITIIALSFAAAYIHRLLRDKPAVLKVQDDPVRLVIRNIRTEWGKPYNPYTLYMGYYVLDGKPALSPIDVLIDVRIINISHSPVRIEAWAFDTGPKETGPWVRLLRVPGSPHIDIYAIGGMKSPFPRVELNDVSERLKSGIPPTGEIEGWMLLECPTNLYPGFIPCLGNIERITLKDVTGREFREQVTLEDYNQSHSDGLQQVAPSSVFVFSKRESRPGLLSAPIVRPFPLDAYRVDRTETGHSLAHVFTGTNK